MKKQTSLLNNYFLKDINPVIRFLIISDTVFVGAVGLLGPVFALFVDDFIQGGTAAVAGTAAGVYLFTKSILQIPIAHFIDKHRGEHDDFFLLVLFSILTALVPILYLFISTPLQLYVVQFFLGLCAAFTFPTYMAIFTRHVDKNKEGTEWGLYYTLVDLTSAGFAVIGGYVAATYGFHVLICATVIISVSGALLILPIRSYMRYR